MDILRFITAGSVDDGKSTLIGRLLYDSKSILEDQIEILSKQSKNKLVGEIDLALLTDGLRAEREQGITIDVAYKYFSTPKRKFIIADAPGHIQYTRNMVTGASNADLIIILIDARHGVVEQTRRHSLIASLLRIPKVVVAVNKMDLVNNDETKFTQIVSDYQKLANHLELRDVFYIPVSALGGDNIVYRTDALSWFDGPPLLTYLESVSVDTSVTDLPGRFQVQYVIRPQTDEWHDYRGYAGRVQSGVYKTGDRIKVLPSGYESQIKTIEHSGALVDTAGESESVIFQLEDDIDISRGDSIVLTNENPILSRELEGTICWMDQKKLAPGNKYLLQHNSRVVKAIIKEIVYKIDVNTFDKTEGNSGLELNDIARVRIKLASELVFDSYLKNRSNGAAILIDETSLVTVGALMID